MWLSVLSHPLSLPPHSSSSPSLQVSLESSEEDVLDYGVLADVDVVSKQFYLHNLNPVRVCSMAWPPGFTSNTICLQSLLIASELVDCFGCSPARSRCLGLQPVKLFPTPLWGCGVWCLRWRAASLGWWGCTAATHSLSCRPRSVTLHAQHSSTSCALSTLAASPLSACPGAWPQRSLLCQHHSPQLSGHLHGGGPCLHLL